MKHKERLDVLLVAPCTGNTLGKLANGITDTPVTMAVKAHLRGDRPVVLAVSTNDGLSGSAAGLGALLLSGVGDTMRVSLTADPVQEVLTAKDILKAAGLRKTGVNIVACPTCGRTRIDLIGLANQVEQALAACEKPITVAVMGCVVNGPGEAPGGRHRHRRRRRLRHSVRQGQAAQKAPLRRAAAHAVRVHREVVKP